MEIKTLDELKMEIINVDYEGTLSQLPNNIDLIPYEVKETEENHVTE